MKKPVLRNCHMIASGTCEHVSDYTETIQNAAMSIPELLKRAMLGTVDASGFLRVGDYDSMDEKHDLLDSEPMPTFYSAAEAEEYVAQAKRRAKNEIDRYNESHKKPEKEEPAAQPEGVQSGSDAE